MESESLEMPAEIAAELLQEERVIWNGRPRTGFHFRLRHLVMVPIGLFILFVFAVAQVGGVNRKHASTSAATATHPCGITAQEPSQPKELTRVQRLRLDLLLAPTLLGFLAAGVYMAFGSLLLDRRRRARTHYALTNDRVVIITGAFRPTLIAIALRTISTLTLNEYRRSLGTIKFGNTGGSSFSFWPWPIWVGARQPAFELIPHAKAVLTEIRAAQKAA